MGDYTRNHKVGVRNIRDRWLRRGSADYWSDRCRRCQRRGLDVVDRRHNVSTYRRRLAWRKRRRYWQREVRADFVQRDLQPGWPLRGTDDRRSRRVLALWYDGS